MTREEAIEWMSRIKDRYIHGGDEGFDNKRKEAIDMAIEALTVDWIPCSERLPDAENCPMDCMVTRRSKVGGNYVDMAVAEADGTWTHEDWKAISYGDVESGRKTGLISTRDDEIIAWRLLPKPYKGGDTE